jgi:hypothetical protein
LKFEPFPQRNQTPTTTQSACAFKVREGFGWGLDWMGKGTVHFATGSFAHDKLPVLTTEWGKEAGVLRGWYIGPEGQVEKGGAREDLM